MVSLMPRFEIKIPKKKTYIDLEDHLNRMAINNHISIKFSSIKEEKYTKISIELLSGDMVGFIKFKDSVFNWSQQFWSTGWIKEKEIREFM